MTQADVAHRIGIRYGRPVSAYTDSLVTPADRSGCPAVVVARGYPAVTTPDQYPALSGTVKILTTLSPGRDTVTSPSRFRSASRCRGWLS